MRKTLRPLMAAVALLGGMGCVQPTLAEPPSVPASSADSDAPTAADLAAAAKRIAEGQGLGITDLAVGKGNPALTGAIVRVHYTGWLYDPKAVDGKGLKFDSSLDRNQPFTFPLGQERVIRGWDLGVAGMQVGGKRRLLIPSELAYGARGAGGLIPPNATLLFEVELLSFRPPM